MSAQGRDGARTPKADAVQISGLAWLERLSRIAIWVSGFAYILVCGLVAVEVLLRKFVGITLGGIDEISSYVLAISTAWAFSFTLLQRAHIRIDVLYNLLPTRLCAVLDIVALAALAWFTALLTYWAGVLFATSAEFGSTANTPLQTPMWIPQGLWIAGLVLFLATVALLLVRALWRLVQGDLAEVRRIAGVRTVEDEIQDEIGPDVPAAVHGHTPAA
jgi:TRAP-type C4-dicarboxylate transport system permease small subunit